MNNKSGKGKALVIVIIILVLLLLAGGGAFAWYYFTQMNKPPVVVKLYEEFEEGAEVDYEEFETEELTPLEDGLKEYKNEELGVRFGYIDTMGIPEDESAEDGLYVSTASSSKKSTVV